jgi:hypothetical protein
MHSFCLTILLHHTKQNKITAKTFAIMETLNLIQTYISFKMLSISINSMSPRNQTVVIHPATSYSTDWINLIEQFFNLFIY